MTIKIRRLKLLSVVVPMIAIAYVWGGCALVIDLGDEAKLRAEAGTGIEDTGAASIDTGGNPIIDSGAGDTAAPLLCGLPASPYKACASCIEPACCEVSKACANDPACVAGLECIKDCMVQVFCIGDCLGNPNLQNVTNCSQDNCKLCTPGPKCQALGECGITFPKEGALDIIRREVRSVILAVDEDGCVEEHKQMVKYSDAGPCIYKDPNPPQDN